MKMLFQEWTVGILNTKLKEIYEKDNIIIGREINVGLFKTDIKIKRNYDEMRMRKGL